MSFVGFGVLLFKEELLHADNRTRALNASETDDLASVDVEVLHQVTRVQRASASKALFAVNGHDTCDVLAAELSSKGRTYVRQTRGFQ